MLFLLDKYYISKYNEDNNIERGMIMQSDELKELVSKIQLMKSETQTIELKSAENGCPKRLFDSLSSFSNQNDGGIIIFGINETSDYSLCGVYDAQDLQKKVTEQCKQMEPPVRALFTVCEIEGKTIVSAEIPGVDISERPVFYSGVGRIRGSYVRVGESDEPMSEYEIYSFEAFRKRIRDDIRTVDNMRVQLWDQSRLDSYLSAVKLERKNLSDNLTDEEILELMGVTVEQKPTVAGLMTFSRYPQTFFPQLCITAVALPGTEQGEIGESGERFIDNARITGSIPDMLEEAVDFVRRNSRTKTIIDENGKRIDKPEYPIRAVREAILNALVHRDYSVHTENTPIRIEMYRDRMEIINSGGLYGMITIDSLGKVRPETRNAVLANMLELLKITENRYSGIPTIRNEFKNAGLPSPVFSAVRGEFRVVMSNDSNMSSMTIEESIVEFCRIPRSRDEIVGFVGMSRNYVLSKLVKPLVDNHKLNMTNPNKPGAHNQKYIKNENE